MSFSSVVLGRRLRSSEDRIERVGSIRGVAILGLDGLASAAYGPEALLTVLLPLGVGADGPLLPITLAIVGVLLLVFISYRQTIGAYANGGGSFIVAKENLGRFAGVVAAAALTVDYVLNVAVAISAGVGALVSAVPALLPWTLTICLGVLAFLTLLNLRGVRAAGGALAVPTFLFVATLGITIVVGLWRAWRAHGAPAPVLEPPRVAQTMTVISPWLLVRAFANGCTAMTGVEAVSNGVPIFKTPSEFGARRTLASIIGILVALLIGLALVCRAYGITATPPAQAGYQSILSQVLGAVVGRGAFYTLAIVGIVSVLMLSANTSFADFPRLCSLLARDGHLPETFIHRGRRLAFSHGVVVLSGLAAILLVVFHGVTDPLIPLFAIGALLAFTMSQAGMVQHWRRQRGRRRWHGIALNGAGAIATGVTLAVVLAAKFMEGAWISALLVALLVGIFVAHRRRAETFERLTELRRPLDLGGMRAPRVLVPIRRWNVAAERALRFALRISSEIEVVQVLTHDRVEDDLSAHWHELVEAPADRAGVPRPRLHVVASQYRELYAPLLDFVRTSAAVAPERDIAVIVPEIVLPRWYRVFVANHTATLLEALLRFEGGPRIVVIDTPAYVEERAKLAGSRTLGLRKPRPRVGG